MAKIWEKGKVIDIQKYCEIPKKMVKVCMEKQN